MAYTGSASDRLTSVRSAIDKVLNSQEYSVGSRRAKYAELSALRMLEKELMVEVEKEAGGVTSGVSVARIDRPT